MKQQPGRFKKWKPLQSTANPNSQSAIITEI
jgi:hypothetical protein